MDLRDDIGRVVDEWSRHEVRETFLSEPLHMHARRRLIDRIETLLREKGVSTVPQTTPKVVLPPKVKEAIAPIVEAIKTASSGASTGPAETPADAGDTPSMDDLKGKLQGKSKGKRGASK